MVRSSESRLPLTATLIEFHGVAPTIGEDVFLAPTAVLIGDVRAREKKELTGAAARWTRTAADEYQDHRRKYMTNGRVRVLDHERVG
jgi:hypothetical protein